jgi:N-acetyl-anhydromuramyl-L-alanine amidase AmpD
MTFAADSYLARRVEPGLGFVHGALRKRGLDEQQVRAIVVHTTGAGPVSRFQKLDQRTRHGWKTPLDAAVFIYKTIMEFSGHYILDGDSGEIVQCVPEAIVAEHVGHSHYRAYKTGHWATHDTHWWHERWPGKASPLDLAGGKLWTGGTCNGHTIGIEVVPRAVAPRGVWTDTAWQSLIALIRDIGARHHILIDREHIVTHSDASPLSRSVNDRPWDPGPDQWTPERFESHL